jgi:hypothetical protein
MTLPTTSKMHALSSPNVRLEPVSLPQAPPWALWRKLATESMTKAKYQARHESVAAVAENTPGQSEAGPPPRRMLPSLSLPNSTPRFLRDSGAEHGQFASVYFGTGYLRHCVPAEKS